MLSYPETLQEPVSEMLHGCEVVDPYRWLEGNDETVQQWVDAQNRFADDVLASAPVEFYADRLHQIGGILKVSTPYRHGDNYFWEEQQSDQERPVLYIKPVGGERRTLVDLNPPAGETGEVTQYLDYWYPSPDGQKLAFGVSEAGDEMSALYVLDTATGTTTAALTTRAAHSQIVWAPDGSGFCYTRTPEAGAVPANEKNLHHKMYWHAIGDDPANDQMIFGHDRPKEDMFWKPEISADGRHVVINVGQTWETRDVFVYDRGVEEVRPLVVGVDAISAPTVVGNNVLLCTNYGAENYRVLRASLDQAPASLTDWEELIPETSAVMLEVAASAGKLLVHSLVDASSEVTLYDHEGHPEGKLPLPEICDVGSIAASPYHNEFFYGYETPVQPTVVHRYNPDSKEYEPHSVTQTVHNPADYIVERQFVTSPDGTQVPLIISRHRGTPVDGTAPGILYGYGCHGIAETPYYMPTFVPWMEQGGVRATAHIRGGGEYGERWHRDGSRERKLNTIADFIAASEFLLNNGYVAHGRLGIMGVSNSGPVIGAALTRRPELYRAAVLDAPVMDMLRFHKFLIGNRWISEFGNPDDPEDFTYLEAWNPYLAVEEGRLYPAVLFNSPGNDTRVPPLHARKMTAMLQRVTNSNVNPVIVTTDAKAGHVALDLPAERLRLLRARRLAFFAAQLGQNIPA